MQPRDGNTADLEQLDVDRSDVEVGEVEHPLVEDDRERAGRQREVEPGEPESRQRDEGADEPGGDRRPNEPQQRCRWRPRWAIVIAPMPAKLIWHSEMLPAKPTSGISERAITPMAKTRVKVSALASVTIVDTTAVPTRTHRTRPASCPRSALASVRATAPRPCALAARDCGDAISATKRMMIGMAEGKPLR